MVLSFGKFNFTYNSTNKLKLTSVFESLQSATDSKPPYQFEYSLQSMSYTDREDHWGFYNGYIVTEFANTSNKIGGKRPVKEVTENMVFPDLLTKVTYPTGGYTQFNYEPNTYSKVADNPSAQLQKLRSFNYTRTGNDYYNIKNEPETENQYVAVSESTHVYLRLRFFKDYFSPYTACYCRDQGCVFEFYLVPDVSYGVNQLINEALNKTICDSPECSCSNYSESDDGLVTSAQLFYFYYENTNEAFAGGSRIQSITNYDPVIGINMVKNYRYELESGLSSGVISVKPFYETTGNILYNNTVCNPIIPCANNFNSASVYYSAVSPVSPISYTGGSPISYSRVIEEESNGANSIFTFTTFEDYPDVTDSRFKTEIIEDMSYMRGKLKNISHYIQNNPTPVYSKTINYQLAVLYDGSKMSEYSGNRFQSYGRFDSNESYTHGVFFNFVPFNYSQKYYRILNYSELKDDATIFTEIFYDNNYISSITNEKKTSQTDNIINTLTRYPFHFSSGVYKEMADRNIINYPIEQAIRKNSKVISSNLTTYKKSGTNYVPDESFITETTSPITNFNYFNGTTKDPHYSSIAEISYQQYDSYGNILQYSSKNGIVTSLLWDNTNTYLMAKIEGVSYSVVSSLNGKNSGFNSKTLWQSIFTLAPEAMITTYSYSPLYGVKEMTDNAGLTTFYDYDNFGRLQSIKNPKGELLQSYKYFFKRP
jgi:YD repeat-containing protein